MSLNDEAQSTMHNQKAPKNCAHAFSSISTESSGKQSVICLEKYVPYNAVFIPHLCESQVILGVQSSAISNDLYEFAAALRVQ